MPDERNHTDNKGDEMPKKVTYKAGREGADPKPPPADGPPHANPPAPPEKKAPAGQAAPAVPASNAAPHRGAARFEKGAAAGLKKSWQKLGRRGQVLALSGGGLCVVLLVTLLTLTFLPAQAQQPDASFSWSAPSSLAASAGEQALPEKLDEQEYVGTVLTASEDAGLEYAEETLFLGDSNTERMLYYADVTGVSRQNGIGMVGMGITSFTSYRCVRFEGHTKSYTMAEAVGILQPKRVVITFGTNNVGIDLDTFTTHYKAALAAIEAEWPYADIIIGAVFPVDQYRQNTSITMANIDKMNVVLADIARQTDSKFLNWHEAILDEEIGFSGFEYTIQDGAHLSRAGMEAIFEYFRTHAYITEDTRPTLKSIPLRLGTEPGIITQDGYKYPGPFDWSKYSSSTSSATGVSVTFAAYDQTQQKAGGGLVSGSDGSGTSFTVSLQPGGTASVTAAAADGYEFVGWASSHGSCSGASGNQLTFQVPGDTAPGTTITVSALFKKIEQASSSSKSQESSSSSGESSSASSSSEPTPPSSSSEFSEPSVPQPPSSEQEGDGDTEGEGSGAS